jgi:hypothetical protein
LKLSIRDHFAHETDFVNKSMTRQLGVFDFRAFLNLAMLVSESERARLLRQAILLWNAQFIYSTVPSLPPGALSI